MSFRAQAMCKKMARKVGEEWLTPTMKKTLKRQLPNNKIVMGRADRGIFAGRHIQFGNQVSDVGGNKTRRNWKPNIQEKRLYSYVYDGFIRVKVTTHALRCIDKAGGIDEYLLKTPYNKLDNELGVLWKSKIVQKYEELGSTDGGLLGLIETRRKQRLGFVEQEVTKEEVGSSDETADASLLEEPSSQVPNPN